MGMWSKEWESKSMEEKLAHAWDKLNYHTPRFEAKPTSGRLFKVKKWAAMVTHAIYEAHPELREENSLPRYFVAKAGRKQGIYGAALTEFVEKEYEKGTWWKHIPEEVIKSKM